MCSLIWGPSALANPVIPLDIPQPGTPLTRRDGVMTSHAARLLHDIVRRTGGQRSDFIQEARNVALETQALVTLLVQGLIPEYATLTPATGLLSATATSSTLATISVAAHTRSTASAAIQAGSVAGVTRGSVYYVYYSDPTNAGGAVTFAATTSATVLSAAGNKLVGALYVEPPAPTGGVSA